MRTKKEAAMIAHEKRRLAELDSHSRVHDQAIIRVIEAASDVLQDYPDRRGSMGRLAEAVAECLPLLSGR